MCRWRSGAACWMPISRRPILWRARAMCSEWARQGIQVNALAPGYFETDLPEPLRADAEFDAWLRRRVPAGRWGVPSELGGAVVFFASSASDYVNGQMLYVDGGLTAVV